MTCPLRPLTDRDIYPLQLPSRLVDGLIKAYNLMSTSERSRVSQLMDAGHNWLIATAHVCGAFPVTPEDLAKQPQFTLRMPKKGS